MKTEAQFVADRLQAHRDACDGMDTDPVFQLYLSMANPTPVEPTARERLNYCFQPGWMTAKQAG